MLSPTTFLLVSKALVMERFSETFWDIQSSQGNSCMGDVWNQQALPGNTAWK